MYESIVKVWQDEQERELQADRPLFDRPDHRRNEPRRRRFLRSLLSARPARLACSEQPPPVTIRPARIDDHQRLARLAQLDERQAPEGDVLVAEIEAEIVAASSLDRGSLIADPFRDGGDVIALLELRRRQIQSARSQAA